MTHFIGNFLLYSLLIRAGGNHLLNLPLSPPTAMLKNIEVTRSERTRDSRQSLYLSLVLECDPVCLADLMLLSINICIKALSSVSHSLHVEKQKKKLIQFFLNNFLKSFDKTLSSLIKIKSRTNSELKHPNVIKFALFFW